MSPPDDAFEYSWSIPYKPQGTPGFGQSHGTFRRPSIPLASSKIRATPSSRLPSSPDTTFDFPAKSYLPSRYRPALWPGIAFPPFLVMSDPSTISEAEKYQMILSLNNHSVNTLAELRRIERVLASIGTPEVTGPMTSAWQYYVNSHMLLTELRSLTRNYPFSSDLLDEAKRRVLNDPTSNRSWNYGWLVLTKILNDSLIPHYAHYQAIMPAMWGNQIPTVEGVQVLTSAFIQEWTWAVHQMLRHWEQAPVGRNS